MGRITGCIRGWLASRITTRAGTSLALAVLDWVHPNAAAVEAVIAFSVALVAVEKGWILAGRGARVPAFVIAGLAALAIASGLGWTALPIMTVSGLLLFTSCYFLLAAKHQNDWLRVSLTFAFGLVHGFGFAGILVEMALPNDRLIPALLGFNVGVEAGQLGIVLLLWPILATGKRWMPITIQRISAEASAAALCGLGLYWLVGRAFSA
jgi:hypothetical protein